MILSSNENLQVGDIVGNDSESVYFRSFIAPEEGNTIIDITLIIRYQENKFELFRRIDHEISKIRCNSNGVLYALGHFGNLYINTGSEWSDILAVSKFNYLTNLNNCDSNIIAIGGDSTVLKLVNNMWKKLSTESFEQKCMLWDICLSSDGNYYAVGENGILIKINNDLITKIELPTNNRLIAITGLNEGKIAISGSKGLLFIGGPDNWKDYTNLEEDLTDLIFWKNELYVSTGSSILRFDGNDFETISNIKSLKLFSTGNRLWSLGVRTIHYYDGDNWLPFEVRLEI